MRAFGLIGYPLEHSFSITYFSEKFKKEDLSDCQYENYPLEKIEDILPLVKGNDNLAGLNVTIPYKQAVIPFLDELDDEAADIGAVNTIKISRNDKDFLLKGYNTDIYGFENPLISVLNENHKNALILGTGGASKAVAYILKKNGIEYKYVSRNPRDTSIISYDDLTPTFVAQYRIIINTSPVGMYPEINDKPDIPYEILNEEYILYDLIYNPEKTLFLKEGEKRDAIIINGLPMLYKQAEKAWHIWNSYQ